MKLTAFIFLLIFTLVQTLPAVKSICSEISVSIFNPDEEKGANKVSVNTIEEQKEHKNCLYLLALSETLNTIKALSFLHGDHAKLTQPILDMVTPPPNCG